VPELNRRVTLASRPVGLPRVSDFQLAYSPPAPPGPGQVLVRSRCLCLDPHLRPRLDAGGGAGRHLALGETIPGDAVGDVVKSAAPGWRAGDTVQGMFGWQEYAVADSHDLRRVDAGPAPLSAALGVLGLPGLTAYLGLLAVGELREGETVAVSGATGAIGMVAGQIARLARCRVIGLAAGGEDTSWLRDELGFDAVAGCETAALLHRDLALLCPAGIDVYFDTTGGATTEVVLRHLNPGGRIALCGQSSQDNLAAPELGPRCLGELIAKEARAQGFAVANHEGRYAAGRARLSGWLAQGKLGYRESVAQGIEAAPQVFIALLDGRRQGSQLVQLWDKGVQDAAEVSHQPGR
jgi:NADPH:quinone reductase